MAVETGVNISLWAKLGRGAAPAEMHPLICHLLDAGHVAQAMWDQCLHDRLREWIGRALHLDRAALRQWLAFWSSLHDIGKATPAFQKQAKRLCPQLHQELQVAGFPFRGADPSHRHDKLGKVVLDRLFASRAPGGLEEPLASAIATCVTGHHGIFPLDVQVRHLAHHVGRGRWAEQQDCLFAYLAKHWEVDSVPRPQPPQPEDQAAYMVLAGLVSVADWIASCEEYYPYAGERVDLSAYESSLADKAASALARAGWTGWKLPGAAPSFRELFGFEPNELQQFSADMADGLSGPSLILIEAPTGSGKSEAAFQLAEHSLRRLAQQGIYVALPTQATSDQMFRRFEHFAGHLAGEGKVNLHLLHSQAILNPDYQALRPRNLEGSSERPAVVAEEWFTAAKRRLLAPLAVGTVDQSLLSVLQTRHFFVRLFGLAGKVVVLDEVHAYDTYTSHLLQHLLRWLGRMDCTVVLLSATLPAATRCELVQAYAADGLAPATAVPYPRVTTCDRRGLQSRHLQWTGNKRIELSAVASSPQRIADRLGERLADGGCAACICNTVQRSQEVYQAVRAKLAGQGFQVDLLHARFPHGQRREKEQRVVTQFGKEGWANGSRPPKAVLVATQVIEQSLDLDFDLMVTDLAPVDLVFQRAGRLHRHLCVNDVPTERPAKVAAPQLWIVEPDGGRDDPPDFGRDEWVYERYILLRSYLCLLRSGRAWLEVPQDLEPLIEEVYGGQTPRALTSEWEVALREAKAACEKARRRDVFLAECRIIPRPDSPDGILEAFIQDLPDDEGFAARWDLGGLTRKARPSVSVVCLHRVAGRLYLDREGQQPVDLDRPPDRPMLEALLDHSVSLSRWAVVKHFRGDQPPRTWQSAPVLRNCFPLELEDSRTRIGRTTIRLDAELGVVFEGDDRVGEGD